MTERLRFWGIVAVTFLWGYGDRTMHGAMPHAPMPIGLLFLGMALLAMVGVAPRLARRTGAPAERNLQLGLTAVGILLAAATALCVLLVAAPLEYSLRSPAGADAIWAFVIAAWHATTVLAIGLMALGGAPARGG